MLFIFRLEGNRGGGNNFDRVASTFSPRRGSGDDDFSFFLTRRVLFYFISFFFFVREWETYCADNLSDIGAHKDRWNGILVVAAANFSVRDDQCYYVKLVLSCLEDLNRSTTRFAIRNTIRGICTRFSFFLLLENFP